jgi:hypothetical protein
METAKQIKRRMAIIDEGERHSNGSAILFGRETYDFDANEGIVRHKDGTITFNGCYLVREEDIDFKHKVVGDCHGPFKITVRPVTKMGDCELFTRFGNDEIVSIKGPKQARKEDVI